MKKLFLFATIAAAGLFASCSSTDDAISEAQNNPIEEGIDGDLQPIKIGISNLVAATTTRGTGTVGGVENNTDNIQNVWAGQKIKVFMFTKGIEEDNTVAPAVVADPYATTLNLTDISAAQDGTGQLYNDSSMVTPGSAATQIPGMNATNLDTGEAMLEFGKINYYPISGFFDFFGYHADDAIPQDATADATYHDKVNRTDNTKWTVPFVINGSQDLMSTKAAPTAGDIDALGTGRGDEFYCARAARKGVHPRLEFKHLLTRFSFHVKAGSDDAAGQTWTNDTKSKLDYDVYTGADKTDYKVSHYDMTAAKITAAEYTAWTTNNSLKANFAATADGEGKHIWDNATKVITKADRDVIKAKCPSLEGDVIATYTKVAVDATYAVRVKSISLKSKTTGNMAVAWTGDLTDADKIEFTDPTETQLYLKERPHAKKTSADAATYEDVVRLKDFYDADPSHQTTDAVNNLNEQAVALLQGTISKATFTDSLTDAGRLKYTVFTGNQALNEDLIALTPTPATTDGALVGEALIVAPKDDNYEMEVTIDQNVLTNWITNTHDYKDVTYKLAIKKPDGGFKQNYSYDIILTVYSLERIEVIAVIKPWTTAADDITVGGDE